MDDLAAGSPSLSLRLGMKELKRQDLLKAIVKGWQVRRCIGFLRKFVQQYLEIYHKLEEFHKSPEQWSYEIQTLELQLADAREVFVKAYNTCAKRKLYIR